MNLKLKQFLRLFSWFLTSGALLRQRVPRAGYSRGLHRPPLPLSPCSACASHQHISISFPPKNQINKSTVSYLLPLARFQFVPPATPVGRVKSAQKAVWLVVRAAVAQGRPRPPHPGQRCGMAPGSQGHQEGHDSILYVSFLKVSHVPPPTPRKPSFWGGGSKETNQARRVP